MKQPRGPTRPKTPKLPTKTIKVEKRIHIYDTINIKVLLDKLPAHISVYDTELEIVSGYECYGDPDIYLKYYELVNNNDYDREMKVYYRKLAIYNDKMISYENSQKIYLKQKKEYDEWFENYNRQRKLDEARKNLARAEKELKKLKSQ